MSWCRARGPKVVEPLRGANQMTWDECIRLTGPGGRFGHSRLGPGGYQPRIRRGSQLRDRGVVLGHRWFRSSSRGSSRRRPLGWLQMRPATISAAIKQTTTPTMISIISVSSQKQQDQRDDDCSSNAEKKIEKSARRVFSTNGLLAPGI